jgi:hypothetical protein
MAIVLVAGLYGVVSLVPLWRATADLVQIYGPADTLNESEDVEANPESSRPLLSDNEQATDYGGIVDTER